MTDGGGAGREPFPGQLVGVAIQNLAAARLARGFVPLAILFVCGVVGMFGPASGRTQAFALAVGAPVAAGAMLAHALRVVQAAMGRPRRAWMALASLASVLPPALGIWVLGWRGLGGIARWGGAGPVLAAVAWTWLGGWVLRSWVRIVELDRLARIMDPSTLEEGGNEP